MMGAGTVAAMIYNVNRGKDDPPATFLDFVPDYKKKPDEPDPDDEAARAASMVAFFKAFTPAPAPKPIKILTS
jgi:hypothetical protein